jgi:hypothetical protein
VLVEPTGAAFDGKRTRDAAMTAGSPVLSSVGAGFASADVGKPIDVQGAGQIPITGGHLRATIVSVDSAGQVTLNRPALRTVHGALAQWGTDDSAAISAALTALRAPGGGTLRLPPGAAICQFSLDARSLPNITIKGDGRGLTRLWAGAGLDGTGADIYERVDLICALNRTPTPPHNYVRNMAVRGLTLDCTLQSATVNGPGTGLGNYCAIQMQDVAGARVEDCDIVGAYGNGVVFGSIDPSRGAAIDDCIISRVAFRDCVRGPLPSYGGVTGSVVQVGAGVHCRIEHVRFIDSGGPAIDIFNADSCTIEDIHNEGWNGAMCAPGQLGTIGSIHSDFGLVRVGIRDVTSVDAGGIIIGGQMAPIAANAYIPTPGPQGCALEHVAIDGTARRAILPTPALVSGGTVGPDPLFPRLVELTIPSGSAGVSLAVLNPDLSLRQTICSGRTAPGTVRCAVPVGCYTQVFTAGAAPSWSWWQAPNALAPVVLFAAGNAGSPVATSQQNVLRSLRIDHPPGVGVQLVDAWANTLDDVLVDGPGQWDTANAYGVVTAVGGTTGQPNRVTGLTVVPGDVFQGVTKEAS